MEGGESYTVVFPIMMEYSQINLHEINSAKITGKTPNTCILDNVFPHNHELKRKFKGKN